jgi:hypothetical protein
MFLPTRHVGSDSRIFARPVTDKEVRTIVTCIALTDGECKVCARALAKDFEQAFPERNWTQLLEEWYEIEYADAVTRLQWINDD